MYLNELKVKLFADGADLAEMLAMRNQVAGFTTNPTLMRRAGIADYRAFARDLLAQIPDKPISFEVIADDFAEMEDQAREIASWGENVYVKIPITNTQGKFSLHLICGLAALGVKVNVTAVLLFDQVWMAAESIGKQTRACISVFAGRIADTGRDPIPTMKNAAKLLRDHYPNIELIWASPRELLNIFQADAIGCHIITCTPEILGKLRLVGKNLQEYSLETVRMFYRDAQQAGYTL